MNILPVLFHMHIDRHIFLICMHGIIFHTLFYKLPFDQFWNNFYDHKYIFHFYFLGAAYHLTVKNYHVLNRVVKYCYSISNFSLQYYFCIHPYIYIFVAILFPKNKFIEAEFLLIYTFSRFLISTCLAFDPLLLKYRLPNCSIFGCRNLRASVAPPTKTSGHTAR